MRNDIHFLCKTNLSGLPLSSFLTLFLGKGQWYENNSSLYHNSVGNSNYVNPLNMQNNGIKENQA